MKFKTSFTLILLASLLAALLGLARVQVAHAQSTTITDCADDSQLRSAISTATSGEIITFGCSGTIPINPIIGQLDITTTLTLEGNGHSVTLSGQNQVRVLFVEAGVTFNLNALTIAHGFAGNSLGGGLDNHGTLNMSNSTFVNNSATDGGGGLFNNGGTANISNSTFANNSVPQGPGGGLLNVFNGSVGPGKVNISNSTVANNSAIQGGGGLANNGGQLLTSFGSIMADNTGGNCLGVADQGYNLSSDGSCSFGSTSLNNTDPLLDPNGLQNNGGPTQTIALQQNSPAIDHIPTASCPATDQRGDARPDNAETTCDIGAYEFIDPPDTDLGLTNVPANITADATSPQGAVVTYTPPTVVDEDNPLPTANCSPASGSTFAIGTTTVNCSVSDSDDLNSPVSASFTVTVNDTNLGLSNMPSNITTDATSPQGAVVTYTPPTAVDEESPLPSVSCDHASGSTFPIGTTTVTCTVSDSDDTNSPVSQSFTVTVAPVLTASGTSVSATEGKSFSGGVVATGTAYVTGTLSASIDWGDGQTSSGTVTLATNGSYSVTGSHVYDEEGTFAITVTVSESGGSNATATSSASVADAALTANTPTVVIHKLAATLSTVFFDADPHGTASDYTATINWGDGTTSPGTITTNSTSFTATGTHSYAKHKTYTVTVTITDAGGSSATRTLTIKV